MSETPLGGNLSESVRIGDTVHRRQGRWTPAVQALLAHLQLKGFPAPKPLGMDQQGRAVHAFMPGEVHPGWPDPLPPWMFEDPATLVASAKLLRRFHNAVESFVPPTDARWRVVASGPHEVICHNDWSPSNALFRNHIPVAMLDWDSAGPGSRTWDVAASAYWWVPLRPESSTQSLVSKASRFALFCDAYGGIAKHEVFDTLVKQLPVQADFIQGEADAGDPGFSKLADWNIPAVLRHHSDLLVQQRDVWCGPPE